MGSQYGASDIKDHPFFKDLNWALIRSMKVPFKPKIEEACENSLENMSSQGEKEKVESDNGKIIITGNLICEYNIVSFPSANTKNDPFHFTKEYS